jgi:hypothetical protein
LRGQEGQFAIPLGVAPEVRCADGAKTWQRCL